MEWRSTNFYLFEQDVYVDGDFVIPLDKMLDNFEGFVESWSSYGLNTISLTWFNPVDPISGEILDEYGPDLPPWLGGLPSDEKLLTFTELAKEHGLKVIWKPHFYPNTASGGNVNDFFTPSIDVSAFLENVDAYWDELAPKAEAADVDLVIIGTEHAGYAQPAYDAEWRTVIETVRSSYNGLVTYDALGYVGTGAAGADTISFWDALDLIGISMYLPLANDNTPSLAEAYDLMRNNEVAYWWTGAPVDPVAIFENLASTHGKDIFLTEVGVQAQEGAISFPPFDPDNPFDDFDLSLFEQSILYGVLLDTFSKVDSVVGFNWWNNASELASPPGSPGWPSYYEGSLDQFPFMGKPSGDFVRAFWADGLDGAPISGDVFLGDIGNDTLTGTPLADVIVASRGNDIIHGGAGDDRLMAGDGEDEIHGEAGHDTIYGGSSYLDLADRIWGGAGNDLIRGGYGNDFVEGDAGNDVLDGGIGVDTAIYSGNQASYTLTLSPTATSITDRRADGNGIDQLIDIEFLDFDTEAFPFDFNLTQFGGPTGLSESQFESFIELYIAYFNRAPDAVGLYFWGTAFANGTTLEEIATQFIDQDETRATYPTSLSNADFATAVYNNVLGRIPDQAGFDFWVGILDSGDRGRDQFILSVLQGVQDGSPDQAYLSNKIDIGAYFAVHRGMSDVDNASAAMALFDGTQAGIDNAVSAIDGFYADALDPSNGEFLMQVVGVLDDPFALA